MGVSALVRWPNAPTHALDLVKQNILRNHSGKDKGKWSIGIRSYRTVSDPEGLRLDRSLCCVTINDHTFAVLEDAAAPQVAEYASFSNRAPSPSLTSPTGSSRGKSLADGVVPPPPHYKTTLVTAEPVGALDLLLSQLGTGFWTSARQQSSSKNQPATGNQLVIEGSIFAIGIDWLLRVGNVLLAGGAMKGMLIEAEYLPLPKLSTAPEEGTPELLSNMLISVLPDVKNALPVAVTVDDTQWAEVHWNCGELNPQLRSEGPMEETDDGYNDVLVYEADEDPSIIQPGDWTGIERDRRLAFYVVGALKPEGLLST